MKCIFVPSIDAFCGETIFNFLTLRIFEIISFFTDIKAIIDLCWEFKWCHKADFLLLSFIRQTLTTLKRVKNETLEWWIIEKDIIIRSTQFQASTTTFSQFILFEMINEWEEDFLKLIFGRLLIEIAELCHFCGCGQINFWDFLIRLEVF